MKCKAAEVEHELTLANGPKNQSWEMSSWMLVLTRTSISTSTSFCLCFPFIFQVCHSVRGIYSHGSLSCFKYVDFSIQSEKNSCDQACFSLVGIAYWVSIPFFLPLCILITSSFLFPSASFPFIPKRLLLFACSLFSLPLRLLSYYYFWALHQLYIFLVASSSMLVTVFTLQ